MPLVETKNIVIISVRERNSNKILKHCSQVLNTHVVADTVVDSANPCYPISVQLEALTPSCTLESHGGPFANNYWCPDLQNQNLREHDPGTKILKVPLPQSQATPMKSPLRTNNQTNNPGCASQFWPVMGQGWEDGGRMLPLLSEPQENFLCTWYLDQLQPHQRWQSRGGKNRDFLIILLSHLAN